MLIFCALLNYQEDLLPLVTRATVLASSIKSDITAFQSETSFPKVFYFWIHCHFDLSLFLQMLLAFSFCAIVNGRISRYENECSKCKTEGSGQVLFMDMTKAYYFPFT